MGLLSKANIKNVGGGFIANKSGVYVQCEYCGKTVYKTLSQYNKREHHFCSNKCQALFRREQVFEYRRCEICGELFYVSRKSTQRFCSTQCQNKWQTGNTSFKNPKFQGDYVQCEYCGKVFLLGKYRLENNKHHFCSTECRQKWYSNVWSQSEEWKEESKKRAVRILSKNVIDTQTKPQLIVNDILNHLSIVYKNEEPFVYYAIDNYLPEYKLAIEVMGDYWHSSPLKYPEKINDRQLYIVSRDKAKHTYIKNQYDIEILYLWETDILKRPGLCSALVSLYVSNHGYLDNYHSFNYHIDDCGKLVMNTEIIHPRQERQIAC